MTAALTIFPFKDMFWNQRTLSKRNRNTDEMTFLIHCANFMKKLVHGFYHGRKDKKAQRSSMVEKKWLFFHWNCLQTSLLRSYFIDLNVSVGDK